MPSRPVLFPALFCLLTPVLAGAQSLPALQSGFRTPPDDARILMRWWWFGPAITRSELSREMEQMKAGGMGGFEIQPVYPLALDDAKTGLHNVPYLSPEFLDDVHYVNERAHELGLRVSLTLASGWPYGGPATPVTEAAAALHQIVVPVPQGAESVPLPSLENGEQLLAVFAGAKMLALPAPGAVRMPVAEGQRAIDFYVMSGTGQQVKRAAVGAEGFVLDHFSRAAVENHLQQVATPLVKAFGDKPPDSVFSDSLEVFGADWTPDFLAQFRERRGYDLLPHLPDLFAKNQSAEAQAVRHDWGVTLTELIDTNYLSTITQWAHEHGTKFRSQTYGAPAVTLSSNALVDLPEGEGAQWREFSRARWASSASHLYGRDVTSAETWTFLHSPPFRATPLDMKAEADLFFLNGINQLVGHGWPYSPPGIAEPGWSFYAAASFNAHNPWWIAMPDVAKYLQRMSWLLRQGKPANDVAVYLPQDDAYAAFEPGKVAVSLVLPRWITPQLTQAVENAGYNIDYIDSDAIAKRGVPYPVLLLPNVQRISPAALAALETYRAAGGRIIALGQMPSLAPGFLNAQRESEQVAAEAKELFAKPNAQVLPDANALGSALQAVLPADISLASGAEQVGFMHRRLDDADVYFLANTANTALGTTVRFRAEHRAALRFNAMTGEACALPAAKGGEYPLHLDAYASTVFVLSDAVKGMAACSSDGAATQFAALNTGWTVAFGSAAPLPVNALASWADSNSTRFFSGVATYRSTFDVPETKHKRILLDFGQATPVPPAAASARGTRALLDAPVRDAAVVFVNGQRAGSVWMPPYRLDITQWLHEGSNTLSIQVANTAVNALAGQSQPDQRLLWARWGKRAEPQDMENLQPLPAGLLGPVTLQQESSR